MPESAARRQLTVEDNLYRKLNPEHWDIETRDVSPQAFRDKYDAQSFFVERFTSAEEVLNRFARFPFAKKLCAKSNPIGRDLWDRGWAIAMVPAKLVIHLQLTISEIREDGHVNVTAARDYAIDFAEASTVLTEDEIFG